VGTELTTMPARVAAAVLAVGLLAGCADSGDAAPSTSPTPTATGTTTITTGPSSSPTTTGAATTAAVTIPPEARAHTEAGAEAFARFFVDTLNQSQVDADPNTLAAISDKSCRGCNVYIDLAEELRTKGHHADVASLKRRAIGVRPDSTADLVNLDILIDESPSRTIARSGRVVESFPAGKLTIRATLRWTRQTWTVAQALLVTT
jgi:hypothetical protein